MKGVEMLFALTVLFLLEVGRTQPSETIKTTYICPKDFHSIGEKCYYFGTNEVMWMDSHFECQILNSSLAVIKSYRQQNLLKQFVINNTELVPRNVERWIDGIYDWKQQRWKWGSSGETISFNKFSRNSVGEKHNWNCVALNGAKKNKWTARKCTDRHQYICETDTNVFVQFSVKSKKKFDISKCSFGNKLTKYERRKCEKLLGPVANNEPVIAEYGFRPKPTRATSNDFDGWVCPPFMVGLGNKCYYFSNNEMTWTEAHFECRKNNTKLALVRSKSQDYSLRRFLNNFIERHDRWIDGIYDWKTAQWKWAITGQPLTYKGFAKEVIKNKDPSELAWCSIYMDSKLDNQWSAGKQSERKRFICQTKGRAVKKLGSAKLKPPDATISIATS